MAEIERITMELYFGKYNWWQLMFSYENTYIKNYVIGFLGG